MPNLRHAVSDSHIGHLCTRQSTTNDHHIRSFPSLGLCRYRWIWKLSYMHGMTGARFRVWRERFWYSWGITCTYGQYDRPGKVKAPVCPDREDSIIF